MALNIVGAVILLKTLKYLQGSPTLSMAYAGSKFVASILDAVRGKTAVDEYAFVKSDITSASYFSSKILIGVSFKRR